MKLYKVYNGYVGDSAVYVIVVAKDSDEAYQLASTQFEANSYKYKSSEHRYFESYWTNLEIILLSDDLTKSFVSEVED